MSTDFSSVLVPAKIFSLLSGHEQKREYSCFQSAVEMVLKSHGILKIHEYPEQNISENDRRGFEPFAGKTKCYGNWEASFEERKFEPITDKAIEDGRALLKEGIYPIYSFMWPDGSGYHGFVGFLNEMNDISFVTKNKLGTSVAKRFNLMEIILPQKKTEILIVRLRDLGAI